MSELIDRNVLKAKMYQEAFESDTDMQKWDSGCWIRYKLFEKVVDSTPTVPYRPRWHRVEEELPDDTRDVLAVRRYGNDLEKQEVIVAHLSVIMDMKRGFDKWWNATNITHWMPLPEPPKEDA